MNQSKPSVNFYYGSRWGLGIIKACSGLTCDLCLILYRMTANIIMDNPIKIIKIGKIHFSFVIGELIYVVPSYLVIVTPLIKI